MSDERMRQLERRWLESGAEEDETAYLHARVRAGDLPPERLEVAALVGHPAAVAATSGVAQPASPAAVVNALAPHGVDVVLRAGVACLRLVVSSWAEALPDDPWIPRLLETCERWLLEPSERDPEQALELVRRTQRAYRDSYNDVGDAYQLLAEQGRHELPEEQLPATFAAAAFAQGVVDAFGKEAGVAAELIAGNLGGCHEGVWIDLRDELGEYVEAGARAEPLVMESALQAAIQETVLAWALGRPAEDGGVARGPLAWEELPPDRLALLAYAGHAQAGARCPQVVIPARMPEWLEGLSGFGRQACVLAAAAAAERASLHWDDEADRRPERAVSSVRRWVECPCEAHRADLLGALDDAVDAMLAAQERSAPKAAAVGEAAALAAEAGSEEDFAGAVSGAVAAAQRAVPPAKLREAMSQALIGWVLSSDGE